jgi:hypothetical protein
MQTTLLYLPRSMATMGAVVVAVVGIVIVSMVQAPRGVWGLVRVATIRLPCPAVCRGSLHDKISP